MKFFDRIFSKKITSEQAIRTFKSVLKDGVKGDQTLNELYSSAFPDGNAVELAAEVIQTEFKRLNNKSSRNEQRSLLKSIYLKNKEENKLAHQIGSKVDENLVLLFVWAIDQNAFAKVISAVEKEGDMAQERYTKMYRRLYLQRWLLYLLIDVGLSATYLDLFGREVDKTLIVRYELMLDDHIAKMTAELLFIFDSKLWTNFNVMNTEYKFSAVEMRSQAMSKFLVGVELDDTRMLEMATDEYIKAMSININEPKL